MKYPHPAETTAYEDIDSCSQAHAGLGEKKGSKSSDCAFRFESIRMLMIVVVSVVIIAHALFFHVFARIGIDV